MAYPKPPSPAQHVRPHRLRLPPSFRPGRRIRTPPNCPLRRLHTPPLQQHRALPGPPTPRGRYHRALQLRADRRTREALHSRLRLRRPIRIRKRPVQDGGAVVRVAKAVQGEQERGVWGCGEWEGVDSISERAGSVPPIFCLPRQRFLAAWECVNRWFTYWCMDHRVGPSKSSPKPQPSMRSSPSPSRPTPSTAISSRWNTTRTKPTTKTIRMRGWGSASRSGRPIRWWSIWIRPRSSYSKLIGRRARIRLGGTIVGGRRGRRRSMIWRIS